MPQDGKIVVENEHPQIAAGKHLVLDDTHKAHEHGGFKEIEEGKIVE